MPEAERRRLGTYGAECARIAPAFRWVAAENLHLTVRFLGHVEQELLASIAGAVAARPLRAFELELAELGTFQRGALARVVWIGIRRGAEAARELSDTVERECVAAGLEPETRTFQPHLTLARARDRNGSPLPPLPALPTPAPWRADELVLYQSHLGRAGAVYEPLRRLPLA